MIVENELVIKEIVQGIRGLVRAACRDSDKAGRRFGLTAAQSGLIRTLMMSGPTSSADLSRKLYVTPANVTGLVDRLEKKGLVKRVPKEGDRRVWLITLTGEGAKLGRSLPDSLEMKLIADLGDMDPGRVKDLAEAMRQLLDLVGEPHFNDGPVEVFRNSADGSENQKQG